MRPVRLLTCLLLALPLAACEPIYSPHTALRTVDRLASPDARLASLIEREARRMVAAHPQLFKHSPLIAASFVDIDRLGSSSTFGRMASELFAGTLASEGLLVREVKLRESLFIEASVGELLLSREVEQLTRQHAARSMLVGTYAVGQSHLYLSVRIVQAGSALVLASSNLQLPLTPNLRALLGAY